MLFLVVVNLVVSTSTTRKDLSLKSPPSGKFEPRFRAAESLGNVQVFKPENLWLRLAQNLGSMN